MQYVNLGNTGLKVSRICLGMMTYGSKKWRQWVLEEAESRPFIQRAWNAGINFYDTADVYSHGVSEEILGRAIRELAMPREETADFANDADMTDDHDEGLNRKERKGLRRVIITQSRGVRGELTGPRPYCLWRGHLACRLKLV